MIKKHGDRVIDYSSYFSISNKDSKDKYDIDIWFFIPSHLNTNKYKTEDFFRDFATYTRYSAPNLTLNSLNDFYNKKNPLTRLIELDHNSNNFNLIEYELKTLINTLKMSCIQSITTLKAMNKYSPFEAKRNLKALLERLNNILEKLDELYIKAPKEFKPSYLLCLEGVSLRIEKTLYSIYNFSPGYKKFITDEVVKQRSFRVERGFSSITTEQSHLNNKVIYREHLIKKWAESIMYINMQKSKTQRGINHVFLGSAAALAMLVAGFITIFSSKWLGRESVFWFLTALLAYSLKDRFKDIFKTIFLKRMSNLFSDRVKDIVTPIRRRKCGKSKESVTFPAFSDIDSEIQRVRFNYKEDLAIKQYQEDIIHYKKRVKIKSSTLYKNHSRLFGIMEIIRFDLRRWFYKMDRINEKCFVPSNGEILTVKGEREYHFTVIIKLKTEKKTTIQRYRIVANNHKITEIIKVS